MSVALPEFDGRIISVPFSFKEVLAEDATVGGVVTKYVPAADRVQAVVGSRSTPGAFTPHAQCRQTRGHSAQQLPHQSGASGQRRGTG